MDAMQKPEPMQDAFETELQRSWEDPASDELKTVWVKAWQAARAPTFELMQQLAAIGDGSLRHLYRGLCPDPVAGHTVRDDGCPACKVLIEAARLREPIFAGAKT